MGPSMEPPDDDDDDSLFIPLRPSGFRSQGNLHTHPKQETSLHSNYSHEHQRIQHKQSPDSHLESLYGPLEQLINEPRTETPRAMAPTTLRPALVGEPHVHPSRLYGGDVAFGHDNDSGLGQHMFSSLSEDSTMGKQAMRSTQQQAQQFITSKSPHTDQATVFHGESSLMRAEKMSVGQRETLPCGEPYSQPVRSIESDHISPPSYTSNNSETSLSEKESRPWGDDAAQSETVVAPKLPDVDICDETLPFDVRLRSWRKFKSAIDNERNMWRSKRCPPCPKNCGIVHPPPCRSKEEQQQFNKTYEAVRWIECLESRKPPCLRCGKVHSPPCKTPQCNVCEGFHSRVFSCEDAANMIKAAKEMKQRLEQLQSERDKKQTQQQHQQPLKHTADDQKIATSTFQGILEAHKSGLSNEEGTPPDFIASAYRGMLEARLAGVSSDEEKNKITSRFLSDFVQSLDSKRKRDEEEDDENEAAPPSKLNKRQ